MSKKPEKASDFFPQEVAVSVPRETPVVQAVETPVAGPQEAPRKVCGINGCTTWYENPIVMKRHLERQHGIGGEQNRNQPAPRHSEIKLS